MTSLSAYCRAGIPLTLLTLAFGARWLSATRSASRNHAPAMVRKTSLAVGSLTTAASFMQSAAVARYSSHLLMSAPMDLAQRHPTRPVNVEVGASFPIR
jgi:hypothetical protein